MNDKGKKRGRKKNKKNSSMAGFISIVVLILITFFVLINLYGQLNELFESYQQLYSTQVQTPQAAPVFPDEDESAVFEVPQIDLEYDGFIIYEGELELPVNGATGFSPIRMEMRALAHSESSVIKFLEPGEAFLIISEQGDWWEIESGGNTGYVRHELCMINLPDVIPSIRYNNTNTYSSRFASSWYYIPNISGRALYPGRTFNERFGREEYIVAVMYSMAKKIHKAQQSALANGDSLVIYEGFRPLSVQLRVAAELAALADVNEDVYRGLNSSSWSLNWFISTGVSNHQRGCSIDVGLVRPELEYAVTSRHKYLAHISTPFYFQMPSPIHELSIESVVFAHPVSINLNSHWQNTPLSPGMRDNQPAQRLQRYCTDAGLTPLASEWWHFDDMETRRRVPGNSVGDYILTEIFSRPPE